MGPESPVHDRAARRRAREPSDLEARPGSGGPLPGAPEGAPRSLSAGPPVTNYRSHLRLIRFTSRRTLAASLDGQRERSRSRPSVGPGAAPECSGPRPPRTAGDLSLDRRPRRRLWRLGADLDRVHCRVRLDGAAPAGAHAAAPCHRGCPARVHPERASHEPLKVEGEVEAIPSVRGERPTGVCELGRGTPRSRIRHDDGVEVRAVTNDSLPRGVDGDRQTSPRTPAANRAQTGRDVNDVAKGAELDDEDAAYCVELDVRGHEGT